jgi:hypothetical protein
MALRFSRPSKVESRVRSVHMNLQSELPHELEAKRIEKAQIRKAVWAWSGTSGAFILLLLVNRFYPSPVIHWLSFALFLVQTYWFYRVARVSQKLRPVLPPEMEAKRIQIGKRHNSLCVLMVLAMAVPWVGVFILPNRRSLIWLAPVATGFTVLYGIKRIIRHDDEMCQRLGYMCPICHKPLYEPQAATYLTGVCPKCKKNILLELPSGRDRVQEVDGALLRL